MGSPGARPQLWPLPSHPPVVLEVKTFKPRPGMASPTTGSFSQELPCREPSCAPQGRRAHLVVCVDARDG